MKTKLNQNISPNTTAAFCLPRTLIDELRVIALKEDRSVSRQVRILLTKAVKSYKETEASV